MKRPTCDQLDQAAPDDAVGLLCGGFPWLRPSRSFLSECVRWQCAAAPRPQGYFRWHLPRLVATLQVVEPALRRAPNARVLDLATYAPYAILMARYFAQRGLTPEWVRTSRTGATEVFEVDDKTEVIPTAALTLGTGRFPFPDASFDLVLLTEVIEHLEQHPQYTLVEINRVLRPGGRLLVTTPNMTSWKKIHRLSNGNWDFDSPTFSDEWGHRYEYSFFQLRQLLQASAFSPVVEWTRDVYGDDPNGSAQAIQFYALVVAKLLSGQFAQAVKFLRRRGSTLFFLYQKSAQSPPLAEGHLLRI